MPRLCLHFQNKYKESGKKSQSVSVYSQLPQTNEMQFAKAVSEIQSEVREHRVFKICLKVKPQSQRLHSMPLFVIFLSLFCRANIKKQGRRKRPALCTRSCPRLWRLSTPKRWHSCRVRYSHHRQERKHKQMFLCSLNSACCLVSLQVKYKQDGKKEVSSSLYHQLPATTETQLAKELRDICSEVRNTETQSECESVPAVCQLFKVSVCVCVQVKYKEEGKKEISKNLYSLLPETAETQFAKQMSEIQSEVRTLNAPQVYSFIRSQRICVCKKSTVCSTNSIIGIIVKNKCF